MSGQNKTSGNATSAATAAAVGVAGRMPDAGDPVARERLRRLFERRRMNNSGRLSTILSDELRGRVT
jgi:hypothetical protein